MSLQHVRIPSLRQHKPSQQGFTLGGKNHYLGPRPASMKKPPPALKASDDAKIAEWLAGGRVSTPGESQSQAVTVSRLLDAFWTHSEKMVADYRGGQNSFQ
jgi:hypothetical protein